MQHTFHLKLILCFLSFVIMYKDHDDMPWELLGDFAPKEEGESSIIHEAAPQAPAVSSATQRINDDDDVHSLLNELLFSSDGNHGLLLYCFES
jgi:hypothetical protein